MTLDQPPRKPVRGSNAGLMMFLGLGMAMTIEIGVAAGVGWFVGNWVDRKAGVAPLGMIAGIVLFMGVALYHAIFTLKRAQARFEGEGDA